MTTADALVRVYVEGWGSVNIMVDPGYTNLPCVHDTLCIHFGDKDGTYLERLSSGIKKLGAFEDCVYSGKCKLSAIDERHSLTVWGTPKPEETVVWTNKCQPSPSAPLSIDTWASLDFFVMDRTVGTLIYVTSQKDTV